MKQIFWYSAFLATILVPSLFAGSQRAPMTQAEVLREIHLTNQTEIKAGQLAQQKGNTQQVRDYGKRLVTDHSNADQKVKQVAERENVNLDAPIGKIDDKMKAKETELLAKLRDKTGASFDEAFADRMESAHEDAIESLERAKTQLPGTSTAKLITELLPTLKEHEHIANRIDDKT